MPPIASRRSSRTRINLGTNAEVEPLFSYPPNKHEICYIDQTLAETVAHYLNSSLARDGYGDSRATVSTTGNRVSVDITGAGGAAYKQLLPRYLAAGKLGFEASKTLRVQDRWRYNWRFFLPHGISMVNHRSVQLLHFPPDYVLERDQDYLSAHTTVRWAELLVENGAQASETASYQNIIDIAPIAAPSGDGEYLDGVYAAYKEYIVALMKLWLPRGARSVRPMIAFGSPARKWLKDMCDVDLDVLTAARITIDSNLKVPTLAANHPSFIYNATQRLQDERAREDEKLAVAMRVMQQDLIAANWQVAMTENPGADHATVLRSCRRRWEQPSRQRRIYELTYRQLGRKEPAKVKERGHQAGKPSPKSRKAASAVVPQFNPVALDRTIDRLRQEIGASESAPPGQFDL
jgi:hypothetical protein